MTTSTATSGPPMVQVLLATWNGERFLGEQIDSVLAQTWRPLTILARDDGSTDSTNAILASYAQRYPDRFTIAPAGPPTGSARGNFLALMQLASASYVAFCDQDDVWLPGKIECAMKAFKRLEARHPEGTPLLVFGDLSVVDERLHTLAASHEQYARLDHRAIHSMPRLLTQNVVTGCTAIINGAMARVAARMPADAVMHDWWIALLANYMGASEYIATPMILYRQHDTNVVGAASAARPSGIPKWRFHRDRLRHWDRSQAQARALLDVHGLELPDRLRATLEAFLRCGSSGSRIARVAAFLRHGFFQHGLRRNIVTLWLLWDLDEARRQAHADGDALDVATHHAPLL